MVANSEMVLGSLIITSTPELHSQLSSLQEYFFYYCYHYFILFYFETESHYAVQAGLELS